MTMPNIRFFSLVCLLFVALSISGCASVKESWSGLSSKSEAMPAEPIVLDTITVQFELESAKLNDDAKAAIAAFGDKALENAPASLTISGFTDVTGSEKYNKTLSIKRAMAVKTHLDSLELKDIKVIAVGQGEKAPIADNAVRSGRQKNRRAEIQLSKP